MKKLLLGLIITTSSCSYVPFTTDIRSNLETNSIELSKVQFYSSKKIVLSRSTSENSKNIEDGKVVLSEKVVRDNIKIPNLTKGLFVDKRQSKIKIRFEDGEDRGLIFELQDNNKYRLKNSTSVNYDGVWYDLKSGGASILLIKKNQFKDYQTKTRKLKGLTVDK